MSSREHKPTYHTDFTTPSCAVALLVSCPARVEARVVLLLYRIHDECAFGCNLLTNILRKLATIALPVNLLDGIAGNCEALKTEN